jgi:ribosomal protein S18 acetylase RimI-like enzyme
MIVVELSPFPDTTELSEIASIVYPSILDIPYSPDTGQDLNLADTIEPYSNFVGYYLGKVAGFGSIDFKYLKQGMASLENICIHPEFRGLGLGKILVSKLEEEARFKEADTIVLDSLEDATGFYTRLGYKKISEKSSRLGKSLLL